MSSTPLITHRGLAVVGLTGSVWRMKPRVMVSLLPLVWMSETLKSSLARLR